MPHQCAPTARCSAPKTRRIQKVLINPTKLTILTNLRCNFSNMAIRREPHEPLYSFILIFYSLIFAVCSLFRFSFAFRARACRAKRRGDSGSCGSRCETAFDFLRFRFIEPDVGFSGSYSEATPVRGKPFFIRETPIRFDLKRLMRYPQYRGRELFKFHDFFAFRVFGL